MPAGFDDRIHATIDVLPHDMQRFAAVDRDLDAYDGPWKVRQIVWSGPDFRTPTVMRGGICDSRNGANGIAAQLRVACDVLLGIPVVDHEPTPSPLVALDEATPYPRI